MPKLLVPRRKPSVIIPGRQIVFVTADKTTCTDCPCFPKEDPYRKKKKLIACQTSPRSLYELSAEVVDGLPYPNALGWSEDDVANWMSEVVGLPEYRECILVNHIDGMRLMMLEDASKLPEINIHNFDHIKMITSKIRKEYATDFVKFMRSIGLPPRRPHVHSTWFKSRTGPTWGIRQNWTRTGIFRWMKIIMPEPIHLDHWDAVWYQRPDFPRVMFARLRDKRERVDIPHYKPVPETRREYMLPRKFKFESGIADEFQYIWMEHRSQSLLQMEEENKKYMKMKEKKKRVIKFAIKEDSRLMPKKITTEGKNGKDLVLARRQMPKPKFLP